MKKVLSWILTLCLVFSSGCSLFSEKNADQTPDKNKVKQAATDVEGMLREGPGKYAGDKYDEAKVKAELDKFPKNITGEEAYNRLIVLLAEDYEPIVKKLENFGVSYQLSNTPDGQVEEGSTAPAEKLNVEILLDASGSMAGRVSGRTKMDLAKEAIQNFASSLPEGTHVALRVYGHKGSNSNKDKSISCKSTEVVYPFAEYDKNGFQKSLNQFKPTGWTPLAASIEEAKKDLENQGAEGAKNVVYVVSDGVETCGGDPVKAAKELHTSNIEAVVNIIGFDVDSSGQKALKQVAEAGGGVYATVRTQEELKRQFEREKEKVEQEWRDWWWKNRSSVGEQSKEMQQELIKLLGPLDGEFPLTRKQEIERMFDAKNYLEQSSILTGDEASALSNKIRERDRQIGKYIVEWERKLWSKMVDEEGKTVDEINKKYDNRN